MSTHHNHNHPRVTLERYRTRAGEIDPETYLVVVAGEIVGRVKRFTYPHESTVRWSTLGEVHSTRAACIAAWENLAEIMRREGDA